MIANQDGFENLHRAIVVGTVRSASKNVERDLLRIVNAVSAIMPTSAFVVESDSDDNTVELLEELSKRDTRIRFISLGRVEPLIPERIARLRHCRNFYVSEIRENLEYEGCDLVIVADLDGINTAISEETFRVALDTSLEWDALAANQSARYYDILALRHLYWSPNNCILEAEWLTQFIGKKAAWRHAIGDRMLRIPRDLPPIPVNSAFGGLCIYRKWIFEQCDYSEDIPDAKDEIDHVTLHRKARALGAKIFIHPGMINAKWTAHSLNGSPFVRNTKWLAHRLPFRAFLPILRRVTVVVANRK